MNGADVSLTKRVADRFDRLVPAGATCLVAVSGGPDSLALLDLLHLGAELHLRALVIGHVDHGIGADSAAVADGVIAAAAARGLPVLVRQLHLGAGTSETRARTARRAALREMATTAGATAIVLGHHADDQAETVLLRLLHGSGPAGLAGMAARHGRWVRPLLLHTRGELAAHLAARGLTAWDDPANADPRHYRSWLRTEVIPLLRRRQPDIISRINGSARQAAADRTAWGLVPGVLAGVDCVRDDRGISVAATMLRGYRSALRHAVLAAIGREIGVPLGARRLAAVDALLASKTGSGIVDLAGGVQAELAFGRLTFCRIGPPIGGNQALGPDAPVRWGRSAFAVVRGLASRVVRDGWSTAVIPGSYSVRGWRAGDRIRPFDGSGSRAVSVLLREASVPPSQRKNWPVVVTGNDATIVWVPGICRSDAVVPAEGTDEATIATRVRELGDAITAAYPDGELLVLGLLKGSFIFLSDLVRQVNRPLHLDFLVASSYGAGTVSSGNVRLLYDPETPLAGKHLLIVEDIIDSGRTMQKMLALLPASLAVCALLDKKMLHAPIPEVRWVGFDAPPAFLVGYGLDHAEDFRHLPFIGDLS